MRITDSYESPRCGSFDFKGDRYSFKTKRTYLMKSVGANVLATDNDGNPVISVYKYGKGKVILLNYPLEDNMIDGHDAFSSGEYKLYDLALGSRRKYQPIRVIGKGVFSTLHRDLESSKLYVVAVNHSGEASPITLESENYILSRTLYGDSDTVGAYDAAVLEFALKNK